jgi:signal transduction histidine kinase
VYVRADPDRLQQILLNLLTNAIKFTETDDRITTAADVQGETVHIRVRDTGMGIPNEEQARIFDPFIQAQSDPAGDDASDGVGLGLAISRDLAEAMGGSLLVESEEGTGSVFTIRLPRSAPPTA